ncbi:TonB-dependent receptor plug domain-containing protein [Apibacter raozihei]|uniref:TonB-dependent receptor n=1 Tax=Apibacter raozihei TaxID=2500547 RepID=UPI000FE3E2F5|nr:TonB-dependent receptor plug domain-containing protein [Apibacter raozihei]
MCYLKYILLFLFISNISFAQKKYFDIVFIIYNYNHETVENAVITLTDTAFSKHRLLTDKQGKAKIELIPGNYTLTISHPQYFTYEEQISFVQSLIKTIHLETKENELQNIIVTAKESKGVTTQSIIDKKAIELLQPSSFTDILELLPGGISKDPDLTTVNPIRLRQAGSVSGYNTNSLGTSFIIDGSPINTNANLQYSPDPSQRLNGQSDNKKRTTAIGIDMRSISTDDIEKVEIIRGIPSVEYGDLTSGVINIIRKSGGNKLEGRFKADGFSKLYYISKGIDFDKYNWSINTSLDLLDAKSEPRNNFETYKRYTASIRSRKLFLFNNSDLWWNVNLDFTGTTDEEKKDPDTGYDKVDHYKSSYNKLGISNSLELKLKNKWIKNIKFISSLRQETDKINQIKYVQLPTVAALPVSEIDGEYDGIYLNKDYISTVKVEGKPRDIFLKLTSNFSVSTSRVNHDILLGTEWTYSKNNGKGQVYDRYLPPNLSMGSYPRAYKDIPALAKLSFFAEDKAKISIGNHNLILAMGIRTFKMTNMNKSYKLARSFFWEPRMNLQWSLPKLFINNRSLDVDITLGYGEHKKTPTLNILYPDLYYVNYNQLNYYHNNPDYRRVNFQTYTFSRENRDLTVANNIKKEIRLDLGYNQNNFSLTFFEERLTSGFRSMTFYKHVTYKRYNTDELDHSTITSPPDLNHLNYELKNDFATYSKTENGSTTDKKGIEFQFSSKRLEAINTRLTFNGAWFQTKYKNSKPIYKSPDAIVNNQKLPYVGIYKDDEGYLMESFTTNFMADTYLPKLKMNFMLAIQCSWYNLTQYMKKDRYPLYYMGYDQIIHPYTEQDKTDTYLQWLYRNHNDLDSRREPLSLGINLKVSKKMYNEKITLSMFVNKLYSYNQKYVIYKVVQRRTSSPPYFGMEINFKL